MYLFQNNILTASYKTENYTTHKNDDIGHKYY
jgi:hypothetical protein